MQEPVHIAVAGLGLLGASICQTLRDHKFPCTITGISSTHSGQKALEYGIIDEHVSYDEIVHLKSKADLILLCNPIVNIFELIEKLANDEYPWKDNCLVSDVGSTKAAICQKGLKLLGPNHFIGGHPMAGSEKNGIEARDNTLFESALWLLCPTQEQESWLKESLLVRVIQNLGSRIHFIDSTTHDKWLAQVSHLPQLLSTNLSLQTFKELSESISIAGPGYRDMTRLSLSQFKMWESIFKTNEQQIVNSIESYQEQLSQLKQMIQKGNWEELESSFDESFKGRQQVHIPQKGWSQNLIEVIVQVKDQKGMISKVVVPLTEADLDIRDIQLLKIREGSGGTLSLSFSSIQIAEKAVELLSQQGIQAQARGIS